MKANNHEGHRDRDMNTTSKGNGGVLKISKRMLMDREK